VHYNQSLTQFQDIKTGVGCLGGVLTAAGQPSTTLPNDPTGYLQYLESLPASQGGIATKQKDLITPAFCTGGAPSLSRSGNYTSYLPSVDLSYRLKPNWSIYGQFAEGSKIPPSSVFDVGTSGAAVKVLPKPTLVKTVQGGTVLKLKQLTFNADAYFSHFQNA